MKPLSVRTAAVEAFARGDLISGVADRLGVSESIVSKWAHRAGCTKRQRGRKPFAHSLRAKCLAQRAAGIPSDEIAARNGVKRSTISKWAKQDGVPHLKRGRKRTSATEQQIAAMKKLRSEGRTLKSIAEFYGISHQRVAFLIPNVPRGRALVNNP
jgi:transposase-like protein